MTHHYQDNQALSELTLGKETRYIDRYDAALLQPVPRSLNREPLGLKQGSLPFTGADIWTLYELSWLNAGGVPQVAVGEVRVNADSQNLIESKSFKLYLNSFNQTRFDSWRDIEYTLRRDLSGCAQGDVDVRLFTLSELENTPVGTLSGECIDGQDITINDYDFNERLLENAVKPGSTETVEETLVSHVLKSNCLITHQPDWGSLQIHYCGPKIDREALLRYIVSFRHHNEFHEQCVERIFHDIQRYCHPKALTVYARYTRRGGLDINPYRTNQPFTPSTLRLARQ